MRAFLLVTLAMILLLALLAWPAARAAALPEYSVDTGEPCASCHVSPSGGGVRTPRGLAWVAGDRPGVVPALEAALELLGVRLPADQSAYETVPATIPAAEPLSLPAEAPAPEGGALHQWLSTYGGN
jgi:hypothetical protein